MIYQYTIDNLQEWTGDIISNFTRNMEKLKLTLLLPSPS